MQEAAETDRQAGERNRNQRKGKSSGRISHKTKRQVKWIYIPEIKERLTYAEKALFL